MACGNNHISRGYLTSQPTKAQLEGIPLKNDTRKADKVEILKKSGRRKTVDEYYSQIRSDGAIDYLLDKNRNQTLESKLHIHVIHEKSGKVVMKITDRRGGLRAIEYEPIPPLLNPSGNEVRAAEVKLARILRKMDRVK
ncbi:MAG: hypothetical protein M0Z30_15930 [Actinomycetota bacterium]|nr:hypothetical protein [Actinomycetota bacterium]